MLQYGWTLKNIILSEVGAEYIMRNARLDEAQAGIKIAGRNINNLGYEDTTLKTESEEELKSFLMKVKEEREKVGLVSGWSRSVVSNSLRPQRL